MLKESASPFPFFIGRGFDVLLFAIFLIYRFFVFTYGARFWMSPTQPYKIGL